MRLKQVWCAVRHGHDQVLASEGRRVFMRCTSCGYDSPGWYTAPRAPRLRYQGDARRHVLAPARLVVRKTA